MDRFVEEFHPEPSDVAICGSMTQKNEWLKIIDELRKQGLRVSTPSLNETIDWSAFSEKQIIEKKGWLVRRHFANIATSKALLICNYDKNDAKNYIGSNTFLEMGAGFMYGKPTYVLNAVPDQENREEILALEPIQLNGNLDKLIKEVRI
jgi:hypothetical protein